jgi:hypothetical protein
MGDGARRGGVAVSYSIRRKRELASQFDDRGIDVPNLPRLLGLHGECRCGRSQFEHDGDRFQGGCLESKCAAYVPREPAVQGLDALILEEETRL